MSPPDQFSRDAGIDPGHPGLGSNGSDTLPAPGELHIKERRTWKTWQLLVGMLAAALAGMAWTYSSGGGATSASNAPAYKVPTSTGSTTTTTSSSARGSSGSTTTTGAGGSTTTTTGAGGSTTTTTGAGGSTTTSTPPSTAAAGPARVLLGPTQMQGNWTSPAFTTTAASWNIGWAFSCTPAPAGGPSFEVSVTPLGSSPTGTPAISQTGASGQSVTAQSTLGAQTLVVQAPPNCTWVVKVTGS
jgi:hypothetical protein